MTAPSGHPSSATTSRTARRPAAADLLAAAGPEFLHSGAPATDSFPLIYFKDPDTVGGAIDEACARMVSHERTAIGLGLFRGVAHALLVPALAVLLARRPGRSASGDLMIVGDPHQTRVAFGADGAIAAVWPRTRDLEVPAAWGAVGLGGWAALELERFVAAFTPHLRLGRGRYAHAAGSALAHRAELMGRALRDLPEARRTVEVMIRAASPALRPAKYVRVALDQGVVSTPVSSACCLSYRIGSRSYCPGCPQEAEPERTRHLKEYLGQLLRSSPAR